MNHRLHGLYAIPPAGLRAPALLTAAERVLRGGARVLQYRDKGRAGPARLEEARALRRLCQTHDALLIVNDDLELAAACGAHGVHLGREDGPVARARAHLGPRAVIGVSCYADWERALAAREEGADYVAFGAFYPSSTKPQAVRADPELLRRTRRRLGLPAVAIGGITPENAQPLIQAGASMVALIQGLFGAPDPTAAARRIQRLFATEDSHDQLP